jgi:hypothetical protein
MVGRVFSWSSCINWPFATPSHQLVGSFHQLVRSFHQLVESFHQLVGPFHQLVGPFHQLVRSFHQLVGSFHQLVGSFHQLVGPFHQLVRPFHHYAEGFCQQTTCPSNNAVCWPRSAHQDSINMNLPCQSIFLSVPLYRTLRAFVVKK